MARVQMVEVRCLVEEDGEVLSECVVSGGDVIDADYDLTQFMETAAEMVTGQAKIHSPERVLARRADKLFHSFTELEYDLEMLRAEVQAARGNV